MAASPIWRPPRSIASPSDREARVLQFASPSFDAAISEIATVLTAGATLVLPGAERSGEPLADLIRQQRVSHATLPPVLLAELPEDLPLDDPGGGGRCLRGRRGGALVAPGGG